MERLRLRYIIHVIAAVLAFMMGLGWVDFFLLLKLSNVPVERLSVIQLPMVIVSPTPVPAPRDQTKAAEKDKQEALKGGKKDWLDYWPAVVELEGKLGIKTFFGPPNFGENPETDSKERSWILSLNKPIKVRGITDPDPVLSIPTENVQNLQLVLPKPYEEWLGKKVVVRGTLFHAHTGHHHTDVLMDVLSISLAASD